MECKRQFNIGECRNSAMRFAVLCFLMMQIGVYATTSQGDLRLWVHRVNEDDSTDVINNNPITVFMNTTLQFTCYCVNTSIDSTWNISFKHNGYEWATGRCSDARTRVVTQELGGEYTCEAHLPGTTAASVYSIIKHLNVLNPDDLIHASSEQYAVNGSSYSLQCEADDNYDAAVIYWMKPGVSFADKERAPLNIDVVTLQHEGLYTCAVYFPAEDLFGRKTVQLSVVVPPAITHPLPADTIHLTQNKHLSFTIEFNSRFNSNTTVTWFHDNHIIRNGITTSLASYTGNSTLDLGLVSRNDAGIYRAEVHNSFSTIPDDARTASTSVTLSVTIDPVTPTNLEATILSNNKVQLSWTLNADHSDQEPSSLSILLTNLTHFSSSEIKLSGSPTLHNVEVVPGMRYRAVLTSFNEDGEVSTRPIEFRAAIAPPKVTSMSSSRLNMTSFNITIVLAYSGSDTISHFDVKFRLRNSSDWSNNNRVEVIDGGRMEQGFLWYGIVTHSDLAKPSELSVEVVNDANERSTSQSEEEVLIPLSAPSTPTLLSSSHDSLTLSFNLPSKGTPPVLHMIVNFSSPTHSQWECRGVEDKAFGDTMECTVPRLDPETQYTLSVFGLGHTGRGAASQPVTFTTASEDNSLPAWVIIVVALVVTMSIIIILLGIILVIIHCVKIRRKKRNYKFNPKGQTGTKQLDPEHAVLNRPPPPQTIASRLTDMAPPPISPPSTVTPPPCRSTPSTTVTFKFETTSGSSCSNSDISDVHSPSYSYRVTPPPPPTCPAHIQSQQSYISLGRGCSYVQPSLHSTRDSLASCPPAPPTCSTNV